MKLEIIFSSNSMDELKMLIDQHFGIAMKTIQCKMSVFEQYEIRPMQRIFVPKIWSYRILVKDGKYHFGTT